MVGSVVLVLLVVRLRFAEMPKKYRILSSHADVDSKKSPTSDKSMYSRHQRASMGGQRQIAASKRAYARRKSGKY